MLIRLDDPFYNLFTDYEDELRSGLFSEELLGFFTQAVWDYYHKHKRDFAWRNNNNNYHVVVSEVMLQQTQTQRVAEKFEQFLQKFPTFESLANAPTIEVLGQWVGLGYNRRALALQGIAQRVVQDYGGVLPQDPLILQGWKGLGPATAASIVTFAHNKRTVFIETNIRAVFLHIFFHFNRESVDDKLLLPLIEKTVDTSKPREWYYALMDCGVVLKKLYPNPSRKSKHHTKQSRFEGSDRQIRGAIIKLLTQQQKTTRQEVFELAEDKDRLTKIVEQLVKEGFLRFEDEWYTIVNVALSNSFSIK